MFSRETLKNMGKPGYEAGNIIIHTDIASFPSPSFNCVACCRAYTDKYNIKAN